MLLPCNAKTVFTWSHRQTAQTDRQTDRAWTLVRHKFRHRMRHRLLTRHDPWRKHMVRCKVRQPQVDNAQGIKVFAITLQTVHHVLLNGRFVLQATVNQKITPKAAMHHLCHEGQRRCKPASNGYPPSDHPPTSGYG